MVHEFPCEWQETGIRYVSEKYSADCVSGKGPSYYARTLQFTASTRQALHRKSPLTVPLGRPCCLRLPWKIVSRSRYNGRLYTARGPFKDLISRHGWIKIRMSFFLESKCIIVRFRTMVARSPGAEPGCCCRFFRESHWRVVVQPRPLDVETSVPYWADSGSFERLSCERGGTTTGRLCARRKIRVPSRGAFSRRLMPTSSENLLHPPRRESPRLSFDSRSHRILRAADSRGEK